MRLEDNNEMCVCVNCGRVDRYDIADEYVDFYEYHLVNQMKPKLGCLRSNFSNLLACPAITSAKTTGDRAFSIAAPFLWNSLLETLRAVSSVNIFKKQLKSYLFKQAYY